MNTPQSASNKPAPKLDKDEPEQAYEDDIPSDSRGSASSKAVDPEGGGTAPVPDRETEHPRQ